MIIGLNARSDERNIYLYPLLWAKKTGVGTTPLGGSVDSEIAKKVPRRLEIGHTMDRIRHINLRDFLGMF